MSKRATFLMALLTSVFVGIASGPVSAAQNAEWSNTSIRSNVLVQDCRGPSIVSAFSPTLAYGFDFEITTSYKVDHDYSVFADLTGIDHPVIERRLVTFAGIAANTTTGMSLAYDGQFTRIATAAQEEVTITDLTLHLVSSNEESATITVDRDNPGPIDTPEAVLLAYAPRGLDMSLCNYFAGLKIAE